MAIVVGGLIGSGVGALIGTGIGALISYFRDEPAKRRHPDPEESGGGGTADTKQQSTEDEGPAASKIFRKDPDADPVAGSRRGQRCEAEPHSRPYMAYLIKRHEGKKYNACGFLVSENFVLTAAHCQGDEITVILGAHNVAKQEPSQQHIRVRRQIPHPQYDRKTLKNDIMLLQLEKPATLNRNVKTIPLPETGEWLESGTVGTVAGWGRTIAEFNSSAAEVLREVDVEVAKDEESSKYLNYDRTTMLCAAQSQKGGNYAGGDSGSPLVCDGKAQGIISQAFPDGIPPRLYTRVSVFICWIRNEMGRLQP